MLPQCELVINSKPYYFDSIDLFIHSIKDQPYRYRLKIKSEPLNVSWSKWLGHPSDNYVEAETQGPYSLNDIEWIEIDPVEKRTAGKSVPEKEVDHSAAIIKLLEGLSFPYMMTDGIISAYLVKKEL
jgi:hypothetical protein